MIKAVRPNLNKKGTLTVHDVDSENNVNYSKKDRHLDENSIVFLSGVVPHVNQKGALKISRGETNKFPMASLVGEVVSYKINKVPGNAVRVKFNPKEGDMFFHVDGKKVTSSKYAFLQGTKAWVVGPVFDEKKVKSNLSIADMLLSRRK